MPKSRAPKKNPPQAPVGPPGSPQPAPRPKPGEGGPVAAAAKRIRLITNAPEPEHFGTGAFHKPFAKPSQSGTYSPWATTQARRGR